MNELKEEISVRRFSDGTQKKAFSWYSKIVGLFDGALYITALLLGYKEFIAVWLAFKVASRWESAKLEAANVIKDMDLTPKKKIINNALYNSFTFGNALTLIYSAASWKTIIWLQRGNNDKAALIVIIVLLLTEFFYRSVRNQNKRLKMIA
jgi:hypothetical protein